MERYQISALGISVGESFKPITWKAGYDMDFSTGCLFCGHSDLKGYHVEDEQGITGKVAICQRCSKVNAKY